MSSHTATQDLERRDRAPLRLLVAAALALVAHAGALAQGEAPAPLAGWEAEPLRRAPLRQEPDALPREPEGAFQERVALLIAEGDWERVAEQLQARARGEAARGRVVDRAGRHPLGVSAAASEQLRRWPAAFDLVAAKAEGHAAELLRGPSDEAALLELTSRWPEAPQASESAARLGASALEAGRCEEAAAWWRLAAELAGNPAERTRAERRLLWLRARRSAAPVSGRLGPLPQLAPPTLTWARRLSTGAPGTPPQRPLAAAGELLFLQEGGRILSLQRACGRVVWTSPPEFLLRPGGLLRTSGEVLLHAAGNQLSAWRCGDGRALWSRRLALEEISDLRPWGGGWLVSGVSEGRWRVQRLDPEGNRRWETVLWQREPPLCSALTLGLPGQEPARFVGTNRRVRGDGRLAPLADALAITAGGRVALLGAFAGELRWARERLSGLGLGAAGPIDVDLRLGAFELWAFTAHGLLVRLEPRSGASLPIASGLPRDERGPLSGYLLSLDPPTWVWTGGALESAGQAPARLPEQPCWAGAAARGWLALPLPRGLAALRGEARVLSPWPLGPAQPVSLGDAWVLLSEDGVALFGAAEPPAAREAGRGLLQELGSPAWRTRLSACERLEDADLAALRASLPALQLDPSSAREVEFALGEAEARRARRERWRAIAPQASAEQLAAALRDPSGAALRALLPDAAPSAPAAVALRRELLESGPGERRAALLELALRVEPRLEGLLVALIRAPGAAPGAPEAALQLLVEAATRGGPLRGLRLLLRGSMGQGDLRVFQALATYGDQALWERVAPADMAQVRLKQLGVPLGATPAAPAALWEALQPFLAAGR